MFLYTSLLFLTGGGPVLAAVLFLALLGVGLAIQLWLCRIRAPLAVRLLPVVLAALVLLLLWSFYGGALYLPLPAYNSLVRSGVIRVWGILAEGFLLGALAGWIVWLIRPKVTKKK